MIGYTRSSYCVTNYPGLKKGIIFFIAHDKEERAVVERFEDICSELLSMRVMEGSSKKHINLIYESHYLKETE